MGGKTTTSTNKVTIPKEVLDRYNAVNAQAANVAQNPFQKYGTTQEDFVAQFNEQQLKGVQGINDVAGMGAVYENVDKYLNPYTKNVADTTRAQMEQANEQAQSGALGTAVQSGAFGGDRAGVAAANLSNQQNLAMGSTMANIYNQGYTQAVDTSMNDMNRMLGVAGAQLGAGTQMQQTEQAGLDALINQFQQEQGYPFQVAQFLANIAMGTGALSGSTTTGVQMAPFFSDRRLKHDIKKIGEADNGLPIYTFKYKGDENQQTHVGFMADEVEKKNPDAVGLDPSGYKTVDYDKAAQSMGGAVKAFAEGGVAGPYGSKVGQGVGVGSYVPQAYLPVGELMVADPSFAESQTNFLDTLNSAATAGDSVLKFRDRIQKLNAKEPTKETAAPAAAGNVQEFEPPRGNVQEFEPPRFIGGGAGGFAEGGGVKPQVHGDYMSTTLAAQAADKDKKDLMTSGQQSGQQGSAFGNIANTIGSVATIANALPMIFSSDRRLKHDIKRIGKTEKGLPIYTFKYKGDDREQTHVGFMADEVERDHPEAVGKRDGYKTVDYSQAHKFATGGVAGRHGYALDGTVEERLRDAMRLTRDEVPAVQTLGSLPDAGVVAVEAPSGVAPVVEPRPTEGGVAAGVPVGAYEEMASTMREAGIANLAGDKLVPTGVAPADGQIRPKPRPEGLGLAPVEGQVRPKPRPLGLAGADVAADTVAALKKTPAATGVVAAPAVTAPQVGPKTNTGEVIQGGYTPIIPLETQLRFITKELQQPEYSGYLDQTYASPSDAAVAFDSIYERSGGKGNRQAGLYANDIYEAAQNGDMSGLPPNVAQAYDHFIQSGMDSVQASGAAGRLMVESYARLDPNARNTIGGGYGTYGIAQHRGDRLEQLAEFAGVPLQALIDAPVSTPEGRYYSTKGNYNSGLAGSAPTPSGDRQSSGVKPYDERNTLGKMMYDEDGRINRNALLSLFAGLGDMLTSPSPFLLPSIGAGISGAARTYMAREEQMGEITSKNLENANTFMRQYLRAKAMGYAGTPEEYAASIKYTGPMPSEVGLTPATGGETNINSFMGVPLDPFGVNLTAKTEIIVNGKPVEVMAGQTYGYLDALRKKLISDVELGITSSAEILQRVEADLANHNGQIVLADGTTVTDPTYEDAVFGSSATVRDVKRTDELGLSIPDTMRSAQESSRRAEELYKALAMLPSTGDLAPTFAFIGRVGQQLGFDVPTNAAQGYDIASKVIAEEARGAVNELAGSVDTSMLNDIIERSTANPNMEPGAIEELLAVKTGISDYNLAQSSAIYEAQINNPNSNLAEVERNFIRNNKPEDFIDKRRPEFVGKIKRPAEAAATEIDAAGQELLKRGFTIGPNGEYIPPVQP